MATDFHPDPPVPFDGLRDRLVAAGLRLAVERAGWLILSLDDRNYLHAARLKGGETVFTRYGNNCIGPLLRHLEGVLKVRFGPEHEVEEAGADEAAYPAHRQPARTTPLATDIYPDPPVPFAGLRDRLVATDVRLVDGIPDGLVLSLDDRNYLYVSRLKGGEAGFAHYGKDDVGPLLRRLEAILGVRMGPGTARAGAAPAAPSLTFAAFAAANRARCESPEGFGHALADWSLSDWLVATLGELGEAANVAKKLNRVRDQIRGNTRTEAELQAQFRREIADTFIYLDLLAQAAGFRLEDAVRAAWDAKSAEVDYPGRLGPA